jgi:hypothetical protein
MFQRPNIERRKFHINNQLNAVKSQEAHSPVAYLLLFCTLEHPTQRERERLVFCQPANHL